MNEKTYRYLFGPVPSRRFGRSLGIDLVPFKTCTLNCVFCQLGRTTEPMPRRREYVPTDRVLSELEDWLDSNGQADVLTLSGSGEPTLHTRFGDVLHFIRSRAGIPALLLTNGTLFADADVRRAAAEASIVKVSLSAWDPVSFERINRPYADFDFEGMIEGYRRFREQFSGELWMEVFVLQGLNSDTDDMRRIAELARGVKPDRIQLNTAVRPPAETFAVPPSPEKLAALSRLFTPNAEVIADFKAAGRVRIEAGEGAIFAMLQRRPCTVGQIADALSLHVNEVLKYIGDLLRQDRIAEERRGGEVYYRAAAQRSDA